jgi:hypothetical protein
MHDIHCVPATASQQQLLLLLYRLLSPAALNAFLCTAVLFLQVAYGAWFTVGMLALLPPPAAAADCLPVVNVSLCCSLPSQLQAALPSQHQVALPSPPLAPRSASSPCQA